MANTLYQQYRPKSWADLVGQGRAVKTSQRIIERAGFDRGAFFIDCAGGNNSGTGKSSLAWVIANALADPFFIIEIPGAKLDKSAVAVEVGRRRQVAQWTLQIEHMASRVSQATRLDIPTDTAPSSPAA